MTKQLKKKLSTKSQNYQQEYQSVHLLNHNKKNEQKLINDYNSSSSNDSDCQTDCESGRETSNINRKKQCDSKLLSDKENLDRIDIYKPNSQQIYNSSNCLKSTTLQYSSEEIKHYMNINQIQDQVLFKPQNEQQNQKFEQQSKLNSNLQNMSKDSFANQVWLQFFNELMIAEEDKKQYENIKSIFEIKQSDSNQSTKSEKHISNSEEKQIQLHTNNIQIEQKQDPLQLFNQLKISEEKAIQSNCQSQNNCVKGFNNVSINERINEPKIDTQQLYKRWVSSRSLKTRLLNHMTFTL